MKRICADARLLTAERVLPVGPGVQGGFTPSLSFFIGEADDPVAVLLGREQAGIAYLEVLARSSKTTKASASGVIALLRAFFRAVHDLKLDEVTCAVRPGENPGLVRLARRSEAERLEAVAVLRMGLVEGDRRE